MATHSRFTLNTDTLSMLSSAIEACYPDCIMHYKTGDILIFSIPKFGNKVFRFEEVRESYSWYMNAMVGDSYSSGTSINGGKYFLSNSYNNNGYTTGHVTLEFYGTVDGFSIVQNANRGMGNGTIVGGVAKTSDGKYKAFGITSISYLINNTCVIDLETKNTQYLYPVAHERRTGINNKNNKLELHRLLLLTETSEYVLDEQNNNVYFVNLFASISNELSNNCLCFSTFGYLIGNTMYQQLQTWNPRNFFMTNDVIV